MGCILSCFENKEKKELQQSFLTNNPHCFVCNKVFPTMSAYNKHIVNCNRLYKKL